MIYLGYILELDEHPTRGRIAQLRPLCSAESSAASWSAKFTDEELRVQFPNRGLVTWFEPFDYAVPGTVWIFSLREQPTFDQSNAYHDQYRIEGDPTPATELISPGGDYKDIEETCLEIGIILQFAPSRNVYIEADDGTLIGPVTLTETDTRNEWKVVPDSLRMPVWLLEPIDESNLIDIRVGNSSRKFTGPRLTQPKRIQELDWSPPAVLVKRLFKHLRERDISAYHNLSLTNRVVDQIVESLKADDLSSPGTRLIQQRCNRGLRLLKEGQLNEDLLSEFEKALLSMPAVQAEMQQLKEQMRQEAEQELEQALIPLQQDIQTLKSQKEQLSSECNELNKLLEAKQEQLNGEIDQLDDAMTKRLQAVSARPDEFLADELVSRSAMKLFIREAAGMPASLSTNGAHPVPRNDQVNELNSCGLPQSDNAAFEISDQATFVAAWIAHLQKTYGVDISFPAAAAIHAVFLSNRIVVCDFATVRSWLECLRWQQFSKNLVASPLWSKEADWYQATTFLFQQDPSTDPRVVILHNFNAGLVDCYLVPSLLLWNLRTNSSGLNKLFLIPTSGPTNSHSALLLEQVAYVEAHSLISQNALVLKENFGKAPSIRDTLPMGVDPQLVASWLPMDTANTIAVPPSNTSDFDLSPWVVQHFKRTRTFLAHYLGAESATEVATSAHLLPWLHAQKIEPSPAVLQSVKKYLSS